MGFQTTEKENKIVCKSRDYGLSFALPLSRYVIHTRNADPAFFSRSPMSALVFAEDQMKTGHISLRFWKENINEAIEMNNFLSNYPYNPVHFPHVIHLQQETAIASHSWNGKMIAQKVGYSPFPAISHYINFLFFPREIGTWMITVFNNRDLSHQNDEDVKMLLEHLEFFKK